MTNAPDLTTADGQKRAAGEAAALLAEDGMTLGLGTGSTAAWFVRALARRVQAERLSVRGVPTSRQTEALARELGLTVIDLDEAGEIDLTVDGVDEIDPQFVAIKGSGGALLREKLVWTASRRCVAIADASKRVERLGSLFPLPIEVVRFGHETTARRLAEILSGGKLVAGKLRARQSGDGPFLTDEGHLIYDFSDVGSLRLPVTRLMFALMDPGVVEHGLFEVSPGPRGMADELVVATPEGVQHFYNPDRGEPSFSVEVEVATKVPGR